MTPIAVIRPVTLEDLDPLLELAHLTGFGLTTLPRDKELLRGRVQESIQSFKRISERPGGETYLFVMEVAGQVVGTCGIVSKVGGFEPFYAYQIETSRHESEALNVHRAVPFLRLVAEHNGPCEVGSLFLDPGFRGHGAGRLLSLSRFLFMAEYPQRFEPVVIAELRGVIDEEGHSAFWDALGKHFFEIEFPKADYLSMINKKFIADLMPTYPIYIPLLPKEAQAVIGQVHPQTRPALRMLEQEGFTFAGMVDIFEAGPIVSCRRDQIRTVRQSVRAAVREISVEPVEGDSFVICNTRRTFRACHGPLKLVDGGVGLPAAMAEALGVRLGEHVRFAPMYRPKEGT